MPEGGEKRATVVQVITKLELGGAQEHVLHLARHLDRQKFRSCLLAGPGGLLDDEARTLPDTTVEFIPHLIREVRPVTDARAYGELSAALGRIRRSSSGPLLVHTNSSKAGILGRWAARRAGADVVVHTIHGYGFHDRQHPLVRRFYLGLERLTAPVTDAFVAVSRENLETGVRLKLFRREDARVIRSGVVLADFERPARPPSEVRRELGIRPEAPVVGMVACLKPQKAPLDFVRVARLVADRFPEARFLAAGDGELRGDMERLVAESGLEGRLLLLGWRRDVADLLHAMDVLVLTSGWEGLPRVCPQGMAAGLPIVATNVNGIPEAVTEGVTGYLCPYGDVAGLAGRVIRLLENPGESEAMGREGRARFAEFDAAEMLRLTEAHYRELFRGLPGRNRAGGRDRRR